jgi:hypothetical protein
MYADKKEFLAKARSLGLAEAKGALQRPEFMVQTAVATEEKVIDTVDAADVWSAFSASKARVGTLDGLVVTDDPNVKVNKSGKAINTRVSELRQIISASKVGYGNKGFSDILDDARPVIIQAKRAGDYKGNTQDAFVSIARAQLVKNEETAAANNGKVEALTEDEIYNSLMPKAAPSKERDELKELRKIEKALTVLVEGTQGTDTSPPKQPFPSDEAKEALHRVQERIADLTLDREEDKKAA